MIRILKQNYSLLLISRLIKLRTEASARRAEAQREEKCKEELENRRKYEEVKKKRQERRKNVSTQVDTKDVKESRADRARRRLVLCN